MLLTTILLTVCRMSDTEEKQQEQKHEHLCSSSLRSAQLLAPHETASSSVFAGAAGTFKCGFGGKISLHLACKSSGGLRGMGSSDRGNETGDGVIRVASSHNALSPTEDA